MIPKLYRLLCGSRTSLRDAMMHAVHAYYILSGNTEAEPSKTPRLGKDGCVQMLNSNEAQ